MESFVRKDTSVVIPAGSVLVWPGVTRAQHMADTLPAWSMNRREKRSRFAEWIFDEGLQCRLGNPDNSVCYDGVAINPWLGGDFNPYERCDTEASGASEETNERISVSCHPSLCDSFDTPYYKNQPNQECQAKVEQFHTAVREKNVPHGYETNLCRRRPLDAGSTCKLEQGMMQRLARGRSVDDLYHEFAPSYQNEVLSSQGQGLFFKGGNPLYYTPSLDADSQATGLHSILRQSEHDVGGHHVVFRTSVHPVTKERYMHIDRAPLAAIDVLPKGSSPDPAVHVHGESTRSSPTHGDFGWLRNLAADMRNEAELPDKLYPERDGGGKEWSCPLRR